MSIRDFEKAIIAVLRPAGFARFKSRREWHRERSGFLEEVDLQKFRGEELVTVNYALRHQMARLTVQDIAGCSSSEPMFPISGRIGDLIGRISLDWQADDPAGPSAVQALIETRLLPYFERMETLAPYIEQLVKRCPRWSRWGTATHRLELAILLHSTGEAEEARRLLSDAPEKIGQVQQQRVAAIYRHLFSEEPSTPRPA